MGVFLSARNSRTRSITPGKHIRDLGSVSAGQVRWLCKATFILAKQTNDLHTAIILLFCNSL